MRTAVRLLLLLSIGCLLAAVCMGFGWFDIEPGDYPGYFAAGLMLYVIADLIRS